MTTHPLPQAARAEWASLDGPWEVQLEPDAPWRRIVVPWTFEAPLSGIGAGAAVHERVRYRRTFDVPGEWAGRRTLLRFGGVDWRASVSVDGAAVGAHEGGYAHFSFDLGVLEPGPHELAVDVYDPADDAAGQPKGKQRGSKGIWYTRTTGIWRSVWLEPVPDTYLHGFHLTAHVDGRLDVEARAPADVHVEVRAGGEVVATGAAGALRVERPRLWSPDDPFLYDVDLSCGDDRVSTYAAFRSIETRGRDVLVNGEPLRLCGVLDQGFWPDGVYTRPDDDALRADVEAAKALGFNLARKHVKVEDPRWYWWCDRLGLLVAQDMPSSHDLSTAGARERFAREWLEIVGQLEGHPSVAIWIVINEDWGEPPPEFQRELVAATRAADPTRPVIDASGWNQLDDTDLVDVHDYAVELTRHRGKREDVPLLIGECGGISLHVPGHAWEPAFSYRDVADGDELAAAYRLLVEGIPDDVAGFVWTQLSDVEGELNGLLTYDRVPKVSFEAIRAANEAFRRA